MSQTTPPSSLSGDPATGQETVDHALEGQARAPLADPGALAVTAFATTSFMLGIYNANLIDARGAVTVIPVALFFGGLMQIIVAILEVFRGNVFGAVVFGTYGPFWVIYGVLLTLYITTIPAAAIRSALALFLAMFAVLSFFFFVASLRTDMVLLAVFALIFIGLVLLSVGWHQHPGPHQSRRLGNPRDSSKSRVLFSQVKDL